MPAPVPALRGSPTRSPSSQLWTLALAAVFGFALAGTAARATTEDDWSLGADGDWSVGANWSTGLPTASNDVVNSTAFTITHSIGTDVVNSLLSQGAFTLSGGSLQVNTTIQVNNTFTMDGGELIDATVLAGTGGQGISFTQNSANVLSNVTDHGTLDLTNAGYALLTGGDYDNSTININNGGALGIEANLTLTGATVTFGAIGTNYLALDNDGTTLTLAGGTLVHGENGNIGQQIFAGGGAQTLVNNGTIDCDVAAGTFNINPASAALTNGGTLEAQNGGTLNLNGLTIANTGGVIHSDTGSVVNFASTSVTGGSITGASPVFNLSSANFLTNVTVTSNLDLTNGGYVRVSGSDLDNTSIGINSGGVLGYESTGTLTGATITFGGNGTNYLGIENDGTTLTLGTGTLVHGQNGNIGQQIFVSGGTQNLINNGTIDCDVATGTFNINPASAALTNGGTLEAQNGGTLNLNGLTIANTGGVIHSDTGSVVNFASTSVTGGSITGTSPVFNQSSANLLTNVTVQSGLDLTNGGYVQISGGSLDNQTIGVNNGGVFQYQASSTLTGATITFGGVGTNYLGIENDGTTLTLGTGTLVHGQNGNIGQQIFVSGGTQNLINNGTIDCDVATGTFNINPASAALTNGGTLEAQNGGTLNLNGLTIANTGGVIHSDTGSVVNFASTSVTGGNITGTSPVFNQSSANLLTNVTVQSGLDLTNGGYVQISGGSLDNQTIGVNNGGVFQYQASSTLTGATVTFGGSGTNYLGLVNDGTTLTIGAGTLFHGQNADIGQPVFVGGGTQNIVNNGTINCDVATGQFIILPNGSFTNAGTLAATNGGSVMFEPGAFTSNTGQITVGPSSSITTQENLTQTAGATQVDGTLTVNGTLIFDNQGGTLSGSGAIIGAVTNEATVIVGDGTTPGKLTVSDGYTQSSAGTIKFGLAGATPGVDYSQLVINGSPGTATFDGTIDVNLVGGYHPFVTEQFTLIDFTSSTGTFASLQTQTVGFNYALTYNPTDVVLTVTALTATPGPDSLLVLCAGLTPLALLLRRRK